MKGGSAFIEKRQGRKYLLKRRNRKYTNWRLEPIGKCLYIRKKKRERGVADRMGRR